MERIEYNTIDKTDWPRGEWDDEPDKIQWQDEETGMPCLIVRGPMGALCGYVGVSSSNKFFHMNYDDVDGDIHVHGGLTFSNGCEPDADETKHICHRPAAGEEDHVWWFGFDCAHSNDYAPKMRSNHYSWAGTYRDIAYVQNECRALASSLIKYNR